MQGKIIRGIAGFYYVYVEGIGEVECKAKGVFRNRKVKPLVGDDVNLILLSEEKKIGNIEEILPRTSELIRPAVANIDQALVIFAVSDPEPNFNLMDRFLIMMERQKLTPILVFNKTDRGTKEDCEHIREVFHSTGYTVLFTNAVTGEGIDPIRELLQGRVTALAGPSGVGKSSLTNQIQNTVFMQTGQISEKIRRGKHTTRHTELIAISSHTFLMDTPGFSSLYVKDLEASDLKYYYPEFQNYEDQCRFNGCNHRNEPDCMVKHAVEEGKISRIRYENYCQIYDEIKSQKKY